MTIFHSVPKFSACIKDEIRQMKMLFMLNTYLINILFESCDLTKLLGTFFVQIDEWSSLCELDDVIKVAKI